MTARNDITGDELKSRTNTEKYRDGWDRIFSNKKPATPEQETIEPTATPVEPENK